MNPISLDFQMDGSWDHIIRPIGVSARLFDKSDETQASVAVIDGKIFDELAPFALYFYV